MYEIPVDCSQASVSDRGTSDPVLVEKRKDIKVRRTVNEFEHLKL